MTYETYHTINQNLDYIAILDKRLDVLRHHFVEAPYGKLDEQLKENPILFSYYEKLMEEIKMCKDIVNSESDIIVQTLHSGVFVNGKSLTEK